MNRVVEKYLRTYAESEARLPSLGDVAQPSGAPFEVAVVVPLCGEAVDALAGLDTAARATPGLLCVAMVNAEEDAGADILRANAAFTQALRGRALTARPLSDAITLLHGEHFSQLLIDRGQPPQLFPRKTGVGLARKLGSDVVLSLWQRTLVRSPWIYHCDGDTTLPAAHFRRPLPASGAISLPFEHVPSGDPAIDLATFEYEARLHYHVLGLRSAMSPYAYHALGSCLAVHAVSYAHVRGFPKRSAGEDFYLLDKVNKLEAVHALTRDPQQIAARRSTRVPFGTGAAVEKVLAGDPIRVDAPACYEALGALYGQLDRLIETRDWASFQNWGESTAPLGLAAAWASLGLPEALQQALTQTKAPEDLRRRIHAWFDGLKVLRLLHALGQVQPTMPLANALSTALFIPSSCHPPTTPVLAAVEWIEVCRNLRRVVWRTVRET